MAITNKEIIENQLRRINEKCKLDLQLQTGSDNECYLSSNDHVLFSNMECYRSEDEMIEYLCGFEDAIGYFAK